eukprot:scaffold7973_cov315-Pinguiococcus_pyrenoidosus.AAC.6
MISQHKCLGEAYVRLMFLRQFLRRVRNAATGSLAHCALNGEALRRAFHCKDPVNLGERREDAALLCGTAADLAQRRDKASCRPH